MPSAPLAHRLLHPAALTPSGRPVFFPGEVETLLVTAAGVEFEGHAATGSSSSSGSGSSSAAADEAVNAFLGPPVDESASLRDGTVYITTHRLIWVDERPVSPASPPRRAFALPLVALASASVAPLRSVLAVFASPRVRLHVLVDAHGRAILDCSAIGSSGSGTVSVLLVVRGQTPVDLTVRRLNEAMGGQRWNQSPYPAAAAAAGAVAAVITGIANMSTPNATGTPAASLNQGPVAYQQQQQQFSAAMAGVGGILRREAEVKQATDRSLQEAFTDLRALMAKAGEMVKLAQQIRQKLANQQQQQQQQQSPSNPSLSSTPSVSADELQELLLSMGIASPVTKETAGAAYHRQLARELADFVGPVLSRTGGTMLLVDVYCIFNRARGTELISPDDLLKACSLWANIPSPASLRRYDSGVLVVQLKTHNQEYVAGMLQQMVSTNEGRRMGVGIADVAQALRVSPAVAREELLAAESRGLLCRDDAIDGLRFFDNFFITV